MKTRVGNIDERVAYIEQAVIWFRRVWKGAMLHTLRRGPCEATASNSQTTPPNARRLHGGARGWGGGKPLGLKVGLLALTFEEGMLRPRPVTLTLNRDSREGTIS